MGGVSRLPAPINVYTARRPHKRWTFWRILRWTLAVVLMSGVTVGGAVAYYVWNRLERITTTNDPNLKAADKQLAAGRRPRDAARRRARAGLRQALRRRQRARQLRHADADPRRPADEGAVAALAPARPLRPRSTGYGMSKINAAYANGGAPLAIKTVSQVLGVKINYYVPVNFHLFRKTVDTFHGVYIDVDRRYYHANNSAGNYSAIDLQPGYQKLSGLPGAASTCATATSIPTSCAPRASRRSCASSSAASTSGRRARTSSTCSTRCRTTSRCAARRRASRSGPKTILQLRQAARRDPARQHGAGADHRRHADDQRRLRRARRRRRRSTRPCRSS